MKNQFTKEELEIIATSALANRCHPETSNRIKDVLTDIYKKALSQSESVEEEKQSLKVGEWSTCSGSDSLYLRDGNGVGFINGHLWGPITMSNPDLWNKSDIKKVTNLLIGEAEKRGFKEGVSIRRQDLPDEICKTQFEDLKGIYINKAGTVQCFGLMIFDPETGEWAEIIEPEKEPIKTHEYVECIRWDGTSFNKGVVYKVKENGFLIRENREESGGTALEYIKDGKFKPSTLEAYEAQEATTPEKWLIVRKMADYVFEIKYLKNYIKDKEDTIFSLRESNRTLIDQKVHLRKEIGDLKEENEKLKELNIYQAERLAEIEDNNAKLYVMADVARKENRKLKKENEKLKINSDESHKEMRFYKKKLESLKNSFLSEFKK